MDKLTEVELAVLPEHGAKAGKWANAVLAWRANGHPDCVDCFNMRHSLAENQANRVAYLCHELAKALTPLPDCGHPAGCVDVRSLPYIEGVGAANVCGWCATESRFREAIGLAATAVAECDELREKLAVEVIRLESKRTRLKLAQEKLAAAENIADRCISALDDILGPVPMGYVTTEIENTFTVGLAWRAANE